MCMGERLSFVGSKLGQCFAVIRLRFMTNKGKQVMDMRPSKGMSTAQSDEHMRRWTERGWEHAKSEGNYDQTRTHLNFEITKGGKVRPVDTTRSIPERMAENLRSRGIKDPNAGLDEPKFRTVANFIFGGSRDRMRELAFGKQEVDFEHGANNRNVRREKDIENWAQDVYAFVSGKYGEDNIVAFIVHLDEQNPHVHCTLLPIQNGKFAYKEIFAGKDKYEYSAKMKELHTEFAAVNAKYGLDRGTSTSETGARHRSTEEYRRQLSEESTQLERHIDQQKMTLAELQKAIHRTEIKMKSLQTMIDNLKKTLEEKRALLLAVEQKIKAKDENMADLTKQRDALLRDIEESQSKLDDKQTKLEEALRQMDGLRDQYNAISERTDELREQAHHYGGLVHDRATTFLRDELLDTLVSEHQQRLAKMDFTEQEQFDGSMLQTATQKGDALTTCAMYLFAGMVADATDFAETHGGGGTTYDMKWGQDDDEDARAFARRCLFMAAKMLRPASSKKLRR